MADTDYGSFSGEHERGDGMGEGFYFNHTRENFEFDDFITELLSNSGLTGEFLFELMKKEEHRVAGSEGADDKTKLSSLFFKPIQSLQDLGVRAATIFTAPILLSIAAISSAMFSIAQLLFAAKNAVTGHYDEAKDNLIMAAYFAVDACVATVSAAVSPIANTIDVLGGAINTYLPANEPYSFN